VQRLTPTSERLPRSEASQGTIHPMQLIGYSASQVDVSAVPGLGGVLSWTEATLRQTARRAVALASLIDRVGSTLDDVAELRRAAEIIAANLSELGASAAGIDRNAGEIAEEISGLSTAAQGIDTHAQKLATGIDELVAILPTLRRLTEIVDPLDNTVVRLGRFVDRIPGAGRRRTLPSDDA
jgi:hypothetical protein